jgi:sterol desaturase/sphingolipid hydroxylase (fatty acid hydroxylase superfamily)
MPPRWLGPALVAGVAAGLVLLERRRPLRRPTQSENARDLRNLVIAAAAGATVRLVETTTVVPLAALAARRRWGLLNRLGLQDWARLALGFALMDYTLYLWHILTHRVRLLWRFHLVHHADLDLSASTALRFHFGELALSVPWRALQVLAIGVNARELKLWQQATLVSILFHHSNLRLPHTAERALSALVTTPRLHGIHHSTRRGETGSNWSSGLTLWDRLHGTLRRDVPQASITIGLPAHRDRAGQRLGAMLALPFRRQRDSWRWPALQPSTQSGRPRMRATRTTAAGSLKQSTSLRS